MSQWLTRTQLAEKLGTHLNSIYRLEKRPDFPKRSESLGPPRWRDDEIEAYMENGRRPKGSARPQAAASPRENEEVRGSFQGGRHGR